MKWKKTLWTSSATLALMGVGLISTEDVDASEWQARTVEEVLQDISSGNDSKSSYTVKWGDTLSVISQALDVDMQTLAEVNNIADIDLIYTGNELTATYDESSNSTNIQVDGADGEQRSYDASENESGETQVEEVRPEENQAPVQDDNADDQNETSETQSSQEETSQTESSQEQTSEETSQEQTSQETSQEQTSQETSQEQTSQETSQEQTSEQAESGQITTEEPVAVEELPEEVQPTVENETDLSQDEINVEPQAPEVNEKIEEDNSQTPAPRQNNEGLSPEVADFKYEVANEFGITEFSGLRPGDPGDHGRGKAIDFMVYDNSSLGDQVAQYAVNEMFSGNENINYVIWEQHIIGDWYGGRQWTLMEDRGNPTANHMDHVHVSFN